MPSGKWETVLLEFWQNYNNKPITSRTIPRAPDLQPCVGERKLVCDLYIRPSPLHPHGWHLLPTVHVSASAFTSTSPATQVGTAHCRDTLQAFTSCQLSHPLLPGCLITVKLIFTFDSRILTCKVVWFTQPPRVWPGTCFASVLWCLWKNAQLHRWVQNHLWTVTETSLRFAWGVEYDKDKVGDSFTLTFAKLESPKGPGVGS